MRFRQLTRADFLDAVAFLIPVTQFVEIKVIGRLFGPDLLLLGLLPLLLGWRGRLLRHRLPRVFIILAVLWLASQVATDLFRETPFQDYSRGWAKIGFTLTSFLALYLLLYKRRRRIVLFAIGLATGGLVGYFANPGIYAAGAPWKFGYGGSVTWFLLIAAIGLAGWGRKGWLAATGLVLGVSAVNLYMGFRSLGGILFLVAAYMMAQAVWAMGSRTPHRIRPRDAVLLSAVLGVAAFGMLQLYSDAAESGLLGPQARQKYEQQSQGEYGLLIGGRSEMLVSLRAIADSPVLGHGSWAKDYYYASLLVELKRRLGYYPGQTNELSLIPSHSYVLGAWVEAGVLGALFWVWVLSLAGRTLLRSFALRERLTPLVAFIALSLTWGILFSPFGANARFVIPFYIVVMITSLAHRPLNDTSGKRL